MGIKSNKNQAKTFENCCRVSQLNLTFISDGEKSVNENISVKSIHLLYILPSLFPVMLFDTNLKGRNLTSIFGFCPIEKLMVSKKLFSTLNYDLIYTFEDWNKVFLWNLYSLNIFIDWIQLNGSNSYK